jgi:hypothetical protein
VAGDYDPTVDQFRGRVEEESIITITVLDHHHQWCAKKNGQRRLAVVMVMEIQRANYEHAAFYRI